MKVSGAFLGGALSKKSSDFFLITGVIALAVFAAACGKKGPPLPPLVRLPVAPADLVAARRADTVEVQFTVPSANTDNTRPANVVRVDIYAFTGPATASEAEVLSQGTRVASVAVKAPRDPDATFDPDDPNQSAADVDPPEGEGLDQGAVARVQDKLAPVEPASESAPVVRTYLGVGISTGGRRGPFSRRAVVPLAPPPPAPAVPEATYTESAVTLTWPPVSLPPATLPDGLEGPMPAYHVYEVTASSETQLTSTPLVETRYTDSRMTWGATRCYSVRTVETVDSLSVESEASASACVMLADTFPPAAPKGLQAVASEGVISLIWDANTEPDLDGYYLLRGPAPGDELVPVQTATLRETAFQDRVPSGMRYVYAVQAVDRSGNLSAVSNRTEETAR
jgi:hypothetical protein